MPTFQARVICATLPSPSRMVRYFKGNLDLFIVSGSCGDHVSASCHLGARREYAREAEQG